MNANAKPWWERFFDSDNGLQWAAVGSQNSPWAKEVLPWIEFAQHENIDLPIVLPRLEADGIMSWYCGGRSPRGILRLQEALQSFIGPSYSDFDGRPYMLNANDPVEAAFAEGTITPTYRIHASTVEDVPKILRVLELYRGLLERMPKQSKRGQRPLGTLRAELDRAVVAGNESEANRLLDRIRAIGRLDAENLLYLQISVLSRLGHWREIGEDGAILNQLTGLRLPPRVLVDVHDALYRLYVEPSEDVNAPQEALAAFKIAGLHMRSTLFGMRRGIRAPRVLKAFFLYELAREDAIHPRLSDLASELEQLDDTFAHALLKLHSSKESPSPTDSLSEADDAFDNFEIDRALELCLYAPPSKKRLTRLIRCAEDIGTVEVARRVLDAIESEDDAESLPAIWQGRLAALEELVSKGPGAQVPQGWLDWARQVDAGRVDEDLAMAVLRDHLETWDPKKLRNDKVQASELVTVINNSIGIAESIFREAAPLIYEALIPEGGVPQRHLKPLLLLLVTKIALLEDPSPSELELASDIATTLLTIGMIKDEYTNLITDLEDLLGTQISVSKVGWALDLVELLAIHTCPESEHRLRLVLGVVEKARTLAHRLKPMDTLVVQNLCLDYGIECPTEFVRDEGDINVAETVDTLAGKKIGIYTLEEPAGQRAASLLVNRCDTVHVELNHDHECTSRLANLARSADIFVFAWKSSKHQAFYCVKDNRNGPNPMIQAQGKGTSSILRAILGNG
jgi:hypothetical protein